MGKEDSEAAQVVRGPQLAAGGFPPVRIPVVALRWRPGAGINTTPTWPAVQSGLYCYFHQLQTGALLPKDVELTVCCVDGRWFCAREEEDYKFGALLFYQVLHRDMLVECTCRVGSVHALLDIPKGDLANAAGLSARSVGALWRVPPLEEEDFFNAFMLDAPKNFREAVKDFLHHRRRSRVDESMQAEAKRNHEFMQAEAKRNPIGSVIQLPNSIAAQAQQLPYPSVSLEQTRDTYLHDRAMHSAMHTRARS